MLHVLCEPMYDLHHLCKECMVSYLMIKVFLICIVSSRWYSFLGFFLISICYLYQECYGALPLCCMPHAMLCGLSAKSQHNPGAWVLNWTILIIYFLPSLHLFFFSLFFLGGVCEPSLFSIYFQTEGKMTSAVLFR